MIKLTPIGGHRCDNQCPLHTYPIPTEQHITPDGPMKFYLGTHHDGWLAEVSVPLFVSRRRLSIRTRLPRACGSWALDSGGYSELSMYGEWRTTPKQYAEEIIRYNDECGGLEWAAQQDWMCEPWILRKTGKTVKEHQWNTVLNYIDMQTRGLPVNIIPVLQGQTVDDYLRHIETFYECGISLENLPVVGLGSVCRRQNTGEIGRIAATIASMGIKLHGFGVKIEGIERYGALLESSDSMAWSYDARYDDTIMGTERCREFHINCANCLPWAVKWRERIVEAVALPW